MDVMRILQDSGAFLKGHFVLSSGLHSDSYIQCARALIKPKNADFLASELSKMIFKLNPDMIVSPALGGIIIGWEVARKLNIPFIFTERENGVMTLRRGFEIQKGNRVVIVEDVFTTGKSTLESSDVVYKYGGNIIGACAIAKRGDVNFTFPHYYLIKLELKTYTPNECLLCKENIPLVKPGSRGI